MTKLATTGGFLMAGNTTLMIGAKEEDVQRIIDIVKEFSKTRTKIVPNAIMSEFGMINAAPIEVSVGGGTVFVLDVEHFEKL